MSRVFRNETNHYFVTKYAGLLTQYSYHSIIEGSFPNITNAKKFAQCLHDGLNWVHVLDASGRTVCSCNPKGELVIDTPKDQLIFYPPII